MTTTAVRHRAEPPSPEPAQPAGRGEATFLPGVQALRAIAALLVVTYHLWPGGVPGGFAGVDVFFVISGFLITSHIARETERSGRVHLIAFYARRVKRLFPAALSVLAVCVVGTVTMLPMSLWQRSLHEIMASALYFENWALAASSIDYFAAEDPPTAAQHYWSLSVEEQFYIVWPLLFLLVAVLLHRAGRSRRFVALAVPVTILVGSFLYSALVTGSAPGAQYFNTFSRAWEFAAGGVLALTLGAGRLPPWASRILLWAGLATVIGSGFYLNEGMRFPGWIAVLPVLGTVATIAAGTPNGLSPSALVRWRPVQFVGGISYSLYLWHWPVIIFLGRDPGALTANGVNRWLLLALSFVLAIASTYLIENPVRKLGAGSREGKRLSAPRIRLVTLGFGAAAMAVITLACLGGQHRVGQSEAAAIAKVKELRKNAPECLGAASLDPAKPQCAGVMDNRTPVPDPVAALEDRPKGCMQTIDAAALRVCDFGVKKSKTAVAMIGDSHAMHWMATMPLVAEQQKWHLYSMTKGSCSLTMATRTSSPAQATSCTKWNQSVLQWLTKHPEVSEIFVSASSQNDFVAPKAQQAQVALQGYLDTWAKLPSSVKRIVVLRDIPRPRVDVVECSQLAVQRGDDVSACGRPRAQAVLNDPEADAAQQSAATAGRPVDVIDLNNFFCTATECSPGVGGAFVYRDSHHMTATFGRSLTPYLLKAYAKLGPIPA